MTSIPDTTAPDPINWTDRDPRPQTHTLQSLATRATMRRCHNCGADHRTQHCPEIRQALFAPEATE